MSDQRPARSIPQRLSVGAVRGYQHLASWTPSRCRYYPTCSQYTIDAIDEYGVSRGIWMGARRIGRCHPWHEGGFDPVPAHADAHTLTQSPVGK